MLINADDFRDGGEELTKIQSMANTIGKKLITVVSNRPATSMKFACRDVLAMPVQKGRMGSYREIGKPIITKGSLKLYEDKNSPFAVGLMLDTPCNRVWLMRQMKYPKSCVAVNEEILEELKALGEEMGEKTTPNVGIKPTHPKAKSEDRLQNEVNTKAEKIKAQEKMIEELEMKLLEASQQKHDLETSRHKSIEKLETSREYSAKTLPPIEVKTVKEDENGDLVEATIEVTDVIPVQTPEIKELPEKATPVKKRPAARGRTTTKKK